MIIFDQIRKINSYSQEYWQARELAKTLEYVDFGNFERVIKKAQQTCKYSGQNIANHFGESTEMVTLGSGSERSFPSYQLSRYACYLIAMEADGSKSQVALAKSYFAIQTRNQELHQQMIEDQKRMYLREQVTEHNKNLAKTAKQAGVYNYGQFVDYGYLGLYGMKNKDILKNKGLKESDNLMDNLGSEELAANLFRATQAEAKIKRESIYGQEKASKAHYDVGMEVRETIKKIGGTMPESLPPSEHIKQAKKRLKNA